MTEIAYQEPVNPAALRYANRLSDLLFVLARYLNDKGRSDTLWKPGRRIYEKILYPAPLGGAEIGRHLLFFLEFFPETAWGAAAAFIWR